MNGLRACAKKGFLRWLEVGDRDIVALQEVRALPEQLAPELRQPKGWWTAFRPAERKGYSGVGLFAQRPADSVDVTLGVDFDVEGRLQLARWGAWHIANVYFPNGSGKNRDHGRVPYKLDFYRALFDKLQPLVDAGERVLVVGDYNTAHAPIDLARPKSNANKTSGFLDSERAELQRWLDAGWVDTFRRFHPTREGAYTWWAQRAKCRERNVGWRIDYVLASPAAMPFIKDAFIASEVIGSDHCPIGVVIDSGDL